jgi:hypothetical protein
VHARDEPAEPRRRLAMRLTAMYNPTNATSAIAAQTGSTW